MESSQNTECRSIQKGTVRVKAHTLLALSDSEDINNTMRRISEKGGTCADAKQMIKLKLFC